MDWQAQQALFAKYLSGEMTDAEVAELQAWHDRLRSGDSLCCCPQCEGEAWRQAHSEG